MTTMIESEEGAEQNAETMQLRGFLSYAWKNPKDYESVTALAQEMRMRGIVTFRDADDFVHGDGMEERIAEEIAAAHVYVPLLSPESLKSIAVRELEFGPAQQRRADGQLSIVPVARRLGADRAAVSRKVWTALGHSMDADWTGVYPGSGRLTGEQAAEVADAALDQALRRTAAARDLALTVATRGSAPSTAGILVDATELFGGPVPRVGAAADWPRLLAGVRALQCALHARTTSRSLRVVPQCHLSAAFAVGFAFRRPTGWRLDVDSRGASTAPGDASAAELTCRADNGPVGAKTLVVQIDFGATSIESGVTRHLSRGDQPRRRLRLNQSFGPYIPPDRLGDLALTAAYEIKRHYGDARCDRVELFISAPAAFAVHLGSEMGAVGPVALHEHDGDSYVRVLEVQ